MILLSCRSRRSLLALLVILVQIWLGLGASLNLRQNNGDSDSDSDDDETSESCQNGVCTTITKGRGGGKGPGRPTGASASTQGPNSSNTPTNSPGTLSNNPNTLGNGQTRTLNSGSSTIGILPTSGNPTATGGSAAQDHNNSDNDRHRKSDLSTGGIVGLVIGLSILAGLIAMFLVKRRNHLRHIRKQPRGSMFLSSKPASLGPNSSSSEMSQVPFSPSVLSPGAVAAAHVRTAEEQPPGKYGPLNVRPDGTHTSTTPLLPMIQYSDGAPTRQGTLYSNTHTNTADTADAFSLMDSLPSSHETVPPTSWNHSALVTTIDTSASSPTAAQKALPNTPSPSAMHSEMTAYQKALERDDEKSNEPSGSKVDVDPPPLYTD